MELLEVEKQVHNSYVLHVVLHTWMECNYYV